MNQVTEFFGNLFSTSEWPARWHCGRWTDFHGWIYIISDWLIWASYFIIPVIILNYLSRKRSTLKFNQAYVYFAAFILLCGTTHFFDAIMFWIPMYRVNALIKAATAIVSVATVYHLYKILPAITQQRTSLELETEIRRRELAEERLAEANKNLEAFTYIASHDLQEPLRKIRFYASMLSADKQIEKEQHWKALEKISHASELMQTMVRDVLALSTVEETIVFDDVDLNEAVTNALANLEIKVLEKNAAVKVDDLPVVKGNLGYLSQLFMNLVGNAIKFSNQQPMITITSTITDKLIQVNVADNGIGMAAEDLEKIFQPFHRLHAKSQYEGSGIGLAICDKIMHVHQGNIEVRSKPGEGTTFILSFPRVA